MANFVTIEQLGLQLSLISVCKWFLGTELVCILLCFLNVMIFSNLNEDHGIWSHQFTANTWAKSGDSDRFLMSWDPKSLWIVTAVMKLRQLLLGRKAMTNLDNIFKKRERERDHFANKVPYSQSYGFSSSHIQMWELDHKEGWVLKNWCFRTVVLEKTLESPLDWKKIKPVNLKGNKPWLFIGRTDAESEGPLLWPSDAEKQLIAHEFEQTPGNVKGHRSLAYFSSGIKKSRTLISNWITTTASLRLDNILLYVNTKFYSPIHLLMDTDC